MCPGMTRETCCCRRGRRSAQFPLPNKQRIRNRPGTEKSGTDVVLDLPLLTWLRRAYDLMDITEWLHWIWYCIVEPHKLYSIKRQKNKKSESIKNQDCVLFTITLFSFACVRFQFINIKHVLKCSVSQSPADYSFETITSEVRTRTSSHATCRFPIILWLDIVVNIGRSPLGNGTISLQIYPTIVFENKSKLRRRSEERFRGNTHRNRICPTSSIRRIVPSHSREVCPAHNGTFVRKSLGTFRILKIQPLLASNMVCEWLYKPTRRSCFKWAKESGQSFILLRYRF